MKFKIILIIYAEQNCIFPELHIIIVLLTCMSVLVNTVWLLQVFVSQILQVWLSGCGEISGD